MDAASISPLLGVAGPASVERSMQANTPREAAQAAAQQFEAILVRQIVSDAFKPMIGGSGAANMPGTDVYRYFVADVVSQSVTQGGGLGLAKMLVPQLTPRAEAADTTEVSSP